MPAGAVWISAEETSLVDFLLDNKLEAGDGGYFKTTTYRRAVTHIAPLHERCIVKTVKACRNKWCAFCKIYKIIRAIQSVSGWVWDDKTGATITADSSSSWDHYVKQHPAAKPFRNKGWVHFRKVALIMLSTAAGSNIFHPTSTLASNDTNNNSVSPEPKSPPKALADPQDVDDLDHEENFYRPHCRKALALGNKLARQLPLLALCLSVLALCKVLRLFKLNVTEQVVLIDFFRTDRTAADIYSALTEPDVRKEWVRIQLKKLGVMVF
ncbi:hypothetical protein B0H34DRAFT_810484 [Crassisporium funariophilum]|nr:hypothetical protein B0H34DRAFT_810484 [Crassisporium funariophilum]